jgi:hypothetical protein
MALPACGERDDDDDEGEEEHEGGRSVADTMCTSGLRWAGGDEESPNMHPGMGCNECHREEHEGPIFGLAGTVYTEYGEADDCYGAAGVTVEITDANGDVHSLTTRQSGNFYLESSIETPYTARLIGADGSERVMVSEQTVTECNSCHTSEGVNDAPGRIIAP